MIIGNRQIGKADKEVAEVPEDHNTITFSLDELREADMKRILLIVYDALKEKGYNPISQIVGYLLSEDPTYITTHNNARSLVRRIDRDELLKAMVRTYLGE
ncbi:IreB family regulatory phosphoprotein [Acutalibacter caecimuris]|uniref:IreB family regulatory phosphoprotein n=1 Tax=Acutalibacter caecimuris TaxID=3093657 RepID=UPI002AC93DD4|nr:IreB family regulatory phosphoprotein [Acutalibacter sp. M00118]